ncbi:MAG: peptidase M16 [Acidobacteria bacterium]|nr:MAG: peptidase M16 [Acidobacteriota bacterium]
MKKSFVLLLSSLILYSCLTKKTETPMPVSAKVEQSAVQTDEGKPIAVDPKVRIGVLDNGLTYYLRQNKKPENRLEMRLVVNAGSILEEDDQQGLAHFLEHMAFNGTTNFKKMELVNYLESIGMQFGADLNAYTSFEETVYMLQIPTDDQEKLNKGFQILQDWAQGISMEEEEIEKERGVIMEEWRLRRGAYSRIRDKQLPLMFYGSKYAERLPIGKTDIIQNAQREAFTRFYDTWYRPNLMAIVLVGDMDLNTMEEKVISYYKGLTNPEHPKKRPAFEISDHEGTLFSAETDPEMTSSMIQIIYKKDKEKITSESDLKGVFTRELYGMMINNRLRERGKEANPPYLFAYTGFSSLGRNKGRFSQFAMVKEGGFEKGIKALLEEGLRVTQHGFSQSELDRTKTEYLRSLENQVIEGDKIKSRNFAGRYVYHFLNPTSSFIPGEEKKLEYAKEYLDQISLADLKTLTDHTMSKDNRIILLSGPEKEGLDMPDQQLVDSWIDEVGQLKLTAYEDDVLDQVLLPKPPMPGMVVKTEVDEKMGITYLELSNGVRVFLKPTDFQNDEIQFTSYSPGGTSKASLDQRFNAMFSATLVSESGLGAFSSVQLEKKLAGKIASVRAGIGDLFESVSGSCSTKDTEAMFQLLYMTFKTPRLDPEAVESVKNKQMSWLKNSMADPKYVFYKKYYEVFYKNHPRKKRITAEDIEKIDGERAFRFYQDRFADASDFTFVFVGNFTTEYMLPFLEKYVASLPATGRKESWVDHGIQKVRGVVPVTVYKGLEPQSTVHIHFSGDAAWSPEERLAAEALSKVLSIRLRETLREDQGGVYGVRARTALSRWPKETFSSIISFGCAPENVDKLIELAFAEVKKVQQEGIAEDVLQKVRETFIRKRELELKENRFWLEVIEYVDQHDLDIHKLEQYEETVNGIDSEMIKSAAMKYFDFDNVVIGKLFPESEKKRREGE